MTCTDSAALAFYQENAEYVMSYGTSGMERDERRAYNKGKALAATMAAEAYAKANPKRRTPYTRPELEFLVKSYIELDGDAKLARDAFMSHFVGTKHTAESVRACAGQLRSMDKTCPDDTQWTIKSLVREVAHDLYPERFAG